MKRVSLRLAKPLDWPTILRLHQEQNERDGTSYPHPELFDGNGDFLSGIALALVGVRDGKVMQSIVFESRCVEMSLYGCDPTATAYSRRDIHAAQYILENKGFVGINTFVPKVVVTSIEKPLKKAGFKRNDDVLAHFFREFTLQEFKP